MITATEMTIAARMHGMEYGRFSYLLRCGAVEMPPMEEIHKRIVKPKARGNADAGCPVCQYDLNGEFVSSYENVYEAAAALGRENASSIKAALSGRYQSAHKFQWRYMGEDSPGPLERKKVNPAAPEHHEEKPCKHCGKIYRGPKNSRYCSTECKKAAGRAWQRKYYAGLEKKPRQVYTKRCAYCGAEFSTETKKKIYCNDKCTNRAWAKMQQERKKTQNRK